MVSVGSARLGELTVCTNTKITNQSGLTKETVSRQISALKNDGALLRRQCARLFFWILPACIARSAAISITQNLPAIYLLFTLYFLGTLQDEKRGAYQNSGADKKGKSEGFVEKYNTGPNPKGNR